MRTPLSLRLLRPLLLLPLCLAVSVRAYAQEQVEYYGTDALGSIRIVFDPAGVVKGRMDFGPFGEALTPVPLGQKVYAQLTFDGETGLDYAEARMYQSRAGRFSSVDPVYAGLFEPQAWNRYSYAMNNPVVFTDATGLLADSGYCSWTSTDTGGTLHCLDSDMVAFLQGGGRSGGGGATGSGDSGGGYWRPPPTTVPTVDPPTIGPAPPAAPPIIEPVPKPNEAVDTQLQQIAQSVSRTAGPLTRPSVYVQFYVVSAAGGVLGRACLTNCGPLWKATSRATLNASILLEIRLPGLIGYIGDAVTALPTGPTVATTYGTIVGAYYNAGACAYNYLRYGQICGS